MIKGKLRYFLIGSLIGVVMSVGLVVGGIYVLRYFRQGEGLGYAKAYARIMLEKSGASKRQVNRFKAGGRAEKIEVMKELILAYRDRLIPGKKEKRIPFVSKNERAKDTGYDIVVASALDRVFSDGFVLQKSSPGRTVGISAAKGEYEDFQVVVIGGENILKLVRLEFTDLKNESSGFLISQKNIGWRVVGSVPTEKPYYPVKHVGLWPDPFLPPNPVDVFPGVFQPFWTTLFVPPDTEAGLYRGAVKVFAGDALLLELPIFLRVYHFNLPLESHLKTAFDFYGHITQVRYPKGENESPEEHQYRIAGLNERYIIDMLLHRMNPVLNINPTSDDDLERLKGYRRLGLNNFSVGRYGGAFNNNWPQKDEDIERLIPLYQTYAESLELNDLLDFNYIYAWDEGEIGKPVVQKIVNMIHRASPKLKTMVCYHGFWDPVKYPGWGDGIDIWCFQIDNFSETKMNQLKALGKEIWMYVSGPGGTGSPNFIIDTDSMDYRIVPWLCWRYGIKGFLYWCVNWWPIADPFKTAMNTDWGTNGNGLLYYPGPDGPIDSLRIELFRNGMEDYEYLYLLNGRIQALRSAGEAANQQDVIREAEGLLNLNQKIAPSMISFTRDSRLLLERREKIAEMIERIDKISGS